MTVDQVPQTNVRIDDPVPGMTPHQAWALRVLVELARATLAYRDAQTRAMDARYAREPGADASRADWDRYIEIKQQRGQLEKAQDAAYDELCRITVHNRHDLETSIWTACCWLAFKPARCRDAGVSELVAETTLGVTGAGEGGVR